MGSPSVSRVLGLSDAFARSIGGGLALRLAGPGQRSPTSFYVLAVLSVVACTREPKPPPPAQRLGGVQVPGEVLARGERGYRTVCASCHGIEGDGQGRLGVRQVPAPRSFASGVIKFASVPAGDLWTDDDVLRVLHEGLQGTQMLAFKLPEEELRAIVQHLKTFSPRFRVETPGEPVEVPADPWSENGDAAKAAGDGLYASLGCASCHESGRSTPTIWRNAIDAPRLAGYRPKAGGSPERVYQTLAAGVGGIEGKRGLAERHSAREIWALVHYLRAVLDTGD